MTGKKKPSVSEDNLGQSANGRAKDNSTASLAQQKRVLRKQFLAARSELSKQYQGQLGLQICHHVETWLFEHNTKTTPIRTVALYAAMGDEVDLQPLAQSLRARGIVTAYPKCYSQRNMSFYNVNSLEELTPSSFGVPEPPGHESRYVDEQSIDVMLIPGLAYTLDGLRLGYGGGFYDKFLSHSGRAYTRIGIAYDRQLTARLPCGPLDERVSYLATEKGVRSCT
ncbi:5-formyltetrahydrofolate cyclo-ligase [Alicyclobacillus sp. SO9]|uniref:5-formyltetrahydrofolate cyclo-ligase n=1 Tax=Alicyclobacillus sp. SO9 TaxID=2665646 RepID=UPI0018E88A70|nr:5-formyltetrahydrofolate cyclo-ligase [Alicyclobacillus sp. SO9]QQE78599.1 5-formyltetrahydrofolate cyclo-ligase [Alicyclobacillus sp. SO9]